MNSLEFIDREIELLKQCLMINKTHDTLNYKLKYLQQIKSELEAWYAVKNQLESFSADYFNGITENGILMTSIVNENEYQIIKKTLEIKDEL